MYVVYIHDRNIFINCLNVHCLDRNIHDSIFINTYGDKYFIKQMNVQKDKTFK